MAMIIFIIALFGSYNPSDRGLRGGPVVLTEEMQVDVDIPEDRRSGYVVAGAARHRLARQGRAQEGYGPLMA